MNDPVRELAEYLVGNPIPSMREEALNELEYMIRRAIEHVIETREKDIAIRRSFDPRNPFGKNP